MHTGKSPGSLEAWQREWVMGTKTTIGKTSRGERARRQGLLLLALLGFAAILAMATSEAAAARRRAGIVPSRIRSLPS